MNDNKKSATQSYEIFNHQKTLKCDQNVRIENQQGIFMKLLKWEDMIICRWLYAVLVKAGNLLI